MAAENTDLSLEKKLDDDNVSVSRVKSVTAGEVVSLDASEVFLREHNFSDDYLAELLADADMNKRLVRKIDLIVLPLLAGTYVLQYLDKQSMSVCRDGQFEDRRVVSKAHMKKQRSTRLYSIC